MSTESPFKVSLRPARQLVCGGAGGASVGHRHLLSRSQTYLTPSVSVMHSSPYLSLIHTSFASLAKLTPMSGCMQVPAGVALEAAAPRVSIIIIIMVRSIMMGMVSGRKGLCGRVGQEGERGGGGRYTVGEACGTAGRAKHIRDTRKAGLMSGGGGLRRVVAALTVCQIAQFVSERWLRCRHTMVLPLSRRCPCNACRGYTCAAGGHLSFRSPCRVESLFGQGSQCRIRGVQSVLTRPESACQPEPVSNRTGKPEGSRRR